MELNSILETAMQAFRQKFIGFCSKSEINGFSQEMVEKLSECLQESAACAGQTALKTFIESHNQQTDLIEHEGQQFRYKMDSPKHYLTPFGEICIIRRLYQPDQGGDCYIPLDALWGMSGEYATLGVREAVLYAVAHNTPDETAKLLMKCSLFRPSTTAIKHMVEKTGQFLEAYTEALQERVMAVEQAPTATSALVTSLDGVNVRLNEKGQGRGRPAERPTGAGAAGMQSTFKNAMVASISFYGRAIDDSGPERLASRYVARMPEDKAGSFKHLVEREITAALSQCPASTRKVLLMDGHRALWNYAKSTPLYAEFEPVLDFYHSTEHLSKASIALFGEGSRDGFAWYENWRCKLLELPGAANGIIRSIDYYAKVSRLSKSRRKELKTERTFFVRQKKLMTYPEFRRRGLPIGSGPVEAACKSIVKTRLGRSGMRWSIPGGQHVLTLRSLVKSNRWENAWKAYTDLKLAA